MCATSTITLAVSAPSRAAIALTSMRTLKPMGETSAPLLAQWVAMACNQVLLDIQDLRARTLADIVESKIGTQMYAGKTREDIYRDLPEEERMIPTMHRVD